MKTGRGARGFTLVEMMVALSVLAIASVAVFTLLAGALNTDRFLRGSNQALSEVELASRRMMHNLRTASALTSPTDLVAHTSLTLRTQPDPANNAPAGNTVTYTLVGTQLQEVDSRYGTNVIANNVSAFTVTLLSAGSPKSLQITLTIGTQMPVTRQFKVYCRNL